jgi:6-pyruvoyltetrahydropterin/6-carboxytetrahydropterin synthase
MPKAHLSRRYRFSASHRLHSESYDAAENQAVFGKCNNPYGHGHNYVVQVTMSGPVHEATGMVCDLAELDAFATKNLLQRFDHMNLNTLDCFKESVSRIYPSRSIEFFQRSPPLILSGCM